MCSIYIVMGIAYRLSQCGGYALPMWRLININIYSLNNLHSNQGLLDQRPGIFTLLCLLWLPRLYCTLCLWQNICGVWLVLIIYTYLHALIIIFASKTLSLWCNILLNSIFSEHSFTASLMTMFDSHSPTPNASLAYACELRLNQY